MPVKKTVVPVLTLVVLPLLLLIVLPEVVFRVVIPASEYPWAYWDDSYKILRFDTTGPRQGLNTVGPFAQQRAVWRINNYGWNSDIDYEPSHGNRPLVAIIGDSMLAGLEADVDQNLAALFRKQAAGKVEVYGFGCPGRPLSSYLPMSRYVVRNFDPQILVILVSQRNFNDILCSRTTPPGTTCLRETGKGLQEAYLPFKSNRIVRLFRQSAFVRYLYANLGVSNLVRGGWSDRSGVPESAAVNGAAEEVPDPLKQSEVEAAAEYVVKSMVQENPGRRIIFLMCARRGDVYAGNLSGGPDLWKHAMMERLCKKYGADFADLTPDFAERYRKDGLRFEFLDPHWNAHGHATAAESLHDLFVKLHLL